MSWNGLITGYLTTFLYLFMDLYQMTATTSVPRTIAKDSRYLLYGFILYILFREEEASKASQVSPSAKESEAAYDLSVLPKDTGATTFSVLTKKEMEISILICRGLSNREIGETLYITESTVKKHVSHIFEKLQVHNREQLKHLFLSIHQQDP